MLISVDDTRPRVAMRAALAGILGTRAAQAVLVSTGFFAGWCLALIGARAIGWYPDRIEDYVIVGILGSFALLVCPTMPVAGLTAIGVVGAWPFWYFDQPEIKVAPLVIAALVSTASGLRLVVAAPLAIVGALLALLPGRGILLDAPADWLASLGPYLAVNDPSTRVLTLVVVAASLLLGASIRGQRHAVAVLRERNAEILRLRDVDIARASAEERAAVARDVHDVVAHHVAGMVIRAQAAERVADTHPEELREAVRWTVTSGQEALTSMRRVVRVLRADQSDDVADLQAELASLVNRVVGIGTGLEVDTDIRMPHPLPAPVEAALLRIAQEALTNIVLHSDARRVQLRLTVDDGLVRLLVADDGHPVTGPLAAGPLDAGHGGNGIAGMTERVRRLGGSIAVGPARDRAGWAVDVRIPSAASA